MISLYRSKGCLNNSIEKLINKVCTQCNICNKFKKSRSRPKVGLPKSTQVNGVVSVDLKSVCSLVGDPNNKQHILYMTDEFSRFIKGKVIPNKEAETVVNAMMQKWVVGLCGFPRDGIHADQGSEFDNQDLKALCNRQGIKLTISPALAKWCNGGNERRHASVDITIKKLLED